MNLRETYNLIAKNWDQSHVEDAWAFEGMGVLNELLTPQSSILNVGCGPGIEAKFFVDHGHTIFGFDISEEMVALAHKKVPSATFKVMDLKDVETIKDQFDAVCMRAVLLHVPKAEASACVQSIASKIKDRGYFFIAVKERSEGGPDEEVKSEDRYGYMCERFFSYYTTEELRKYFKDSNIEVVFEKVSPTGKTNWIQIIGKKK
jgi:2-polyprenyl-3-methyl-5-hydroxy-6-metoxy-1,4-benzoquinol methylase